MGYTHDQGLRLVMSVCAAAMDDMNACRDADMTWLACIYTEAHRQLNARRRTGSGG